MKPLFLQFSGLNSYREVQTVDFKQLLGGGLFGIFGPTGSGKSTVLDAITLALYGTVERARRRTQGIINQSEKAVMVRFSFALADAAGEVEYRVERSYKRDADGAVRGAVARLVEVRGGAGDRVLADQERTVTEAVTQVLGLEAEDFTRAVVLPQGKFAEFLQLEGVERRGMLQRIFALGQYGDQLNQRLKVRTEAADRQFRETTARQEGLGDASEAAVGQARGRVGTAEALVAEAQRDLAAAEAAWREWQRVWDIQQELTAVQADLAAWQGRAAEAQSQRAEQAAAARAEQVRPALEEQAEAERLVTAARVKLSEATESLRSAAEAEAAALKAHQAVRVQREAEAPRLAERRVRLEQALALEAEVVKREAEAADLANRAALGRTETARLAHDIDTLAEAGARVRTEQAAVLAHLGELDIPADRRALVQRGLLALGNLRQAQDRLSQATERVAVRERELATAYAEAGMAKDVEGAAHARVEAHESAQRTLAANPPDQEAELAANEAWLARTEGVVKAVQEQDLVSGGARSAVVTATAEWERAGGLLATADRAEAEARVSLEAARTRRAEAEQRLEDNRRLDHAAALVGALAEGQPCPVCGSLSHPHPAAATVAGADVAAAQVEYDAATRALRTAEAAFEGAARNASEARTAVQVAEARVRSAEESLGKAEAALAQARAALPQAWGSPAAHQLPALLQAQIQEQKLRRQRFETWRQRVDEARTQRDDLAKAHARATADAAAADARAAGALKAKQDADADLAAAQGTLQDRQIAFAQAGDGLDAAALEAEERRIAGADREMTRLRELLAIHGADQHKLEADLKQKREQHQKYAQALQEREQQSVAARERLDGESRRLAELAGGAAAAPQLAAVQADLARLDAREAAAAGAAEETGRRRAGAGAALAAAQREDELASERVVRAGQTLHGALTLASFPDSTAAAAALRTPARLATLETWLRTYDQEGDRLTARSATLTDQLKGRTLTAAEWATHTSEREQAQLKLDLVKEERTRATQVLDDLTAKQTQWQELERARKTLESDLSYLTELQRLLRGNTFVEFLAEEQMEQVARAASERLGELTRYRYALEVDSTGGFVIADNGNGGLKRPVATLSGGETFLTALALSLALSAQIQLRGTYPLEFFFLDEGFGTLDPELLNTVIDSLERLHYQNLHVGVISHVPELRNRLQRRLIVEPAEAGGRGSQLHLELA